MSAFRGYQCDGCGAVINASQRQRLVQRFEGSVLSGEVHKDLCAKCIAPFLPPEGTEVKTLRRRRKQPSGQKKAAVQPTS
jgi:hypothetical protein